MQVAKVTDHFADGSTYLYLISDPHHPNYGALVFYVYRHDCQFHYLLEDQGSGSASNFTPLTHETPKDSCTEQHRNKLLLRGGLWSFFHLLKLLKESERRELVVPGLARKSQHADDDDGIDFLGWLRANNLQVETDISGFASAALYGHVSVTE